MAFSAAGGIAVHSIATDLTVAFGKFGRTVIYLNCITDFDKE
jgi:hypothetical protein